ncbi:MAG: M48 family metallopeptidase [Oscillospiraceae bacterium]|nr:M48 family metallopeptidase [Oscillospiraceae bacterium]
MENLTYRLIRSDRKTLALQIEPDGTLVVRAPRRMPKTAIDAFILEKRDWIEKHRPRQPVLPGFTEREIRDLGQRALEYIPGRVEYFAPLVGVTYGNITIRNQRTRWGSCSSRGNLNFNCLLMLVPPEVLDYVVVHELCHRKEMNHSPKFWAEVARVLPDYESRRQWLKTNGSALIGRL